MKIIPYTSIIQWQRFTALTNPSWSDKLTDLQDNPETGKMI
ncbi:MAG: hypothetical protein V9822_01645 [Candidatus Dasytiphilus stammeri]